MLSRSVAACARPSLARGLASGRALASSRGLASGRDPLVHATAVVEDGAHVGPGCSVGAFAVVEAGVRLEEGVQVKPHAVVTGDTVVGPGSEIHSFAVVGGPPQDRKHDPSLGPSKLRLGANCVVREFVTVNGGTALGGGLTAIGDNCLLLANSHVGHDCILARGVVVSNLVQLAGHVHVGAFATLGGACTVRQHVNIGRLAMIGGASAVDRHVAPFVLALGNRARLRGLNLVGLRRQKTASTEIAALREATNLIFGVGNDKDAGTMDARAATSLELFPNSLLVRELVGFVRGENDVSSDCVAEWDLRRLRIGHLMPDR
ncbi:Acyl-acyl-carrier-protein--UDP-N-acetylglucosamine O-acyltransferase [Hondaea fermentalgiana]|uniref:Acyl-acyl-carrier-protein--UDP-N-acetylglucosamine O-acyltransferase n=1 Tax=Hondaea fermentalgiana TaxID=2315210 RepID=A0A2R5GD22_9STRA|nr:Acyl-acyl-carrier-protein--UDP-N-acetylglucosamine O-acyltransferase [Hondaea fermentalgiana]|eukprot:GBG26493.1 Acyl-acyl-carrier-protein--UDP-N-acetylglucosamine O-acyltransferase [Hondaea fermentalgiana]